MLAFSNDYYGFIFRATQSVELFCAYHGIGLQNVKKIVEKYNGTVVVSDENNIFHVNIMMYALKLKNE